MKTNAKRYAAMAIVLLCQVPMLMMAQNSYSDYPESEKQYLLHEKFDNNSRMWLTDNKWLAGEIVNGVYFLSCKNYNNSTGLSFIDQAMDTSQNFEVEARVNLINGFGGLIIGMGDNFDHFRLEFSESGEIMLLKNRISKSKMDILFKIKAGNWKTKDFNTICFRKEKGMYYLFVNEVFVGKNLAFEFLGNKLGFSIGLNSKMMADELSVAYLKHGLPDFLWKTPENNGIVNKEVLDIVAEIKSASPIQSARLLLTSGQSTDLLSFLKLNETQNYSLNYSLTLQKGLNAIAVEIINGGGTVTSETRNITFQALQPPQISWLLPVEKNLAVETNNYSIKACIKSVSEIVSTQVYVNGLALPNENYLTPARTEQCQVVVGLNIDLVEGLNSIYIVAVNKEGKATSETRFISYNVNQQSVEKRLALVIGNSNYTGGQKLKNPANDAQLMVKTLKELDFEVISQIDAGKQTMEKAIREFSRKLPEYKVALFYYAGHGLQIDGTNYMIPVDAVLENKSDCKYEAVAVNFVVEEFEQYPDNINIVILDACRNNPYRSWSRGSERGFRAIDPVSGTIIAFATSEGSTASDGESANGLFTEELAKQMMVPQPIESVFKKTRVLVEKRSNKSQNPMEWNKLKGDFYFKK